MDLAGRRVDPSIREENSDQSERETYTFGVTFRCRLGWNRGIPLEAHVGSLLERKMIQRLLMEHPPVLHEGRAEVRSRATRRM